MKLVFAEIQSRGDYIIIRNGNLSKVVLHGLGRLNISHLIMLRKVQCHKRLFLSTNSVLFNTFNFALVHNNTLCSKKVTPKYKSQ